MNARSRFPETILYLLILAKPVLRILLTGISFGLFLSDLYTSVILVLFLYCLFRCLQNRPAA
ncbi:hypothetical protein [Faecalibaculum rodentium]|uniref:hypothetical protein n=1 Tax=Faecalibaculum rodentium TaxID=1702221 RepID=UPI0023F36008|nr:hypothetical protein [Faecalibaculum rodentium]